MKRAALWVLLVVATAAVAAPRERIVEGRVSHVVDGDSLWLKPAGGGAAIEVRLAGIDAPEICQNGGAEARAFLAGCVARRTVRLAIGRDGRAHDRHGRTLATLWVDGVDLNRRLVEAGQAWSSGSGRGGGPYADAEQQARAQRLGVHAAGSAALHPREFRRRHGPCPR